MEVPLQVTYHGVGPSDALSRLIGKEAAKLEEFFSRIVSCRVRIELEQRHVRNGRPFRVRIDLAVPGSELSVDTAHSHRIETAGDGAPMRRKSAEVDAVYKDPALAVRDAFRRARRRLKSYAQLKKFSSAHLHGDSSKY